MHHSVFYAQIKARRDNRTKPKRYMNLFDLSIRKYIPAGLALGVISDTSPYSVHLIQISPLILDLRSNFSLLIAHYLYVNSNGSLHFSYIGIFPQTQAHFHFRSMS